MNSIVPFAHKKVEMSFYPHFSGFYAYPVPYPNQEFYPMYIEGNADNNPSVYVGHPNKFNKPGFNNRKMSQAKTNNFSICPK